MERWAISPSRAHYALFIVGPIANFGEIWRNSRKLEQAPPAIPQAPDLVLFCLLFGTRACCSISTRP